MIETDIKMGFMSIRIDVEVQIQTSQVNYKRILQVSNTNIYLKQIVIINLTA